MEPFSQSYVHGCGIPDVLYPSFFNSTREFAVAVRESLDRANNRSRVLGIATLLTKGDAFLEALAVASSSNEIHVLYPRPSALLVGIDDPASGVDALSPLLRNKKAVLVGFGMARIAMHVRHGLNCHIRGAELAEAAPIKERNLSPGAFVKKYVCSAANTFTVDTLWDAVPTDLDEESSKLEHLALRAWLTIKVASDSAITGGLSQCVLADTKYLTSEYFIRIHQMLIEVEQMEAAKSRVQENDFRGTDLDGNGNVLITNDRFSNRVRPSERAEVWMVDEADRLHRGTARRANGKLTHVAPQSNVGGVAFKAIFVVGKDELSHADRARETFLLHLLQGKHDLREPGYELIHELFFPNAQELIPRKVSGAVGSGRLNQSQADVVEAMLESDTPFVIVHGPPGTGKTSTISAALRSWVGRRNTIWVVAQSNVAVKNIAERLSKDGMRYRLLVSKEFYHEWHEHIYDDRVTNSLIRTDELPARARDVEIMFYDVHIILCTLSTLSNPSLEEKRIFNFVPVVNLVVDEASQIGIFNYMHVFAKFKRLTKVCFFGDPKQLPPFGQDAASTLESVFDVRHLKSQAYFLNIQYRMPVPIGSFISEEVYNGKLRSEHQISSYSCVAFIDVSLGEEEKNKKSYINRREVQTVEHLVRQYYLNKDYCIITPYDAQRNLIHKTLESAGLRSDNIYNVDSFQGNEADFIILSAVRSESPGFLVSRNRVNVMLTRCKQGMVILTSRAFMQQRNVQKTLLGRMCQYWETKIGRENAWHDWKAVAEKKANLPGVTLQLNNGMNSRYEEDLRAPNRPSDRALYLVEDKVDRSPLTLAPTAAQSSARATRATSHILPYRREASPLTPAVVKGRIASLVEELQLTKLEADYPALPSTRFSPKLNPQVVQRDVRGKHAATGFPALATASRPLPWASDAWGRGPPHSVPRRLPSQKLTPFKQAPSQILASGQTKAKAKKRENMFLGWGNTV